METDPKSYGEHGASSSSSAPTISQRPPTSGHRPSSSQESHAHSHPHGHTHTHAHVHAHPHPHPERTENDPRSSGTWNEMSGTPNPSSPTLATSGPVRDNAPEYAESSAQVQERVIQQPPVPVNDDRHLHPDHLGIYGPFVSPAGTPSAVTPVRGPTQVPSSSEQLRNAIQQDGAVAEASGSSSRIAPPTLPVAPVIPHNVAEPSLLTCKPLDRTPSSSSRRESQATLEGGRQNGEWGKHARQLVMERMSSQAGGVHSVPEGVPVKVKKRARSFSDPPESHRPISVQAVRNAAKYFRGKPRKKMRVWTANDAASAAEGERIMRQIRHRATDRFAAAAREPPVNMRSLRVLDTNEVLRLPQMRHDLLFDNFGFRPIHSSMFSSTPWQATTCYGLLSTLRSQIVHPSPACEWTNRYWECIRAEIERGCRCTRWESDRPGARIKECICGRWKRDLSEDQWWKESRATWPSRLPKLIQTLREILESLMVSTTPCGSHYSHSLVREASSSSTGSVGYGSSSPYGGHSHDAAGSNATAYPTVTHSLVPTLFAALDPEFLTIQVRRRNFDADIFRVIGKAMKVHCAPVRDAMVDDMVATATGCDGRAPDVVSGLRKCFDCAEVMKLDIANHQVQSLKGMLWQQAEQNEMSTFINYLMAAGRTLETSKTLTWINAASKRVAMATPPRERRHLMGQCSCSCSVEFVIRSLGEGFIDLVFGDWIEKGEAWPPIVPSRLPGLPTTGHVIPTKVIVPEVFKMDSYRLKNFHAEMVDIAIAQSILEQFKEHFVRQNPTVSADEVAAQVAQVRESYKHVMTLGKGLARTASDCPSDLSLHMAHRIVFARGVYANQPRTQEDVKLVNQLAQEFDQLIANDIACNDADMFLDSLQNLRSLVSVMLTNTLLIHRVQPESFLYDSRGLDAKPCMSGSVQQETTRATPRLRVSSRRFVTLTEPLTGQGAATSDPRERYHRPTDSPGVIAAKAEFASTVSTAQASEGALAERLGFGPLVHEIRAVVDRMVKTADFNLCVFANLYGRPGMLVGSGALVPLPELMA